MRPRVRARARRSAPETQPGHRGRHCSAGTAGKVEAEREFAALTPESLMSGKQTTKLTPKDLKTT